VVLIDEIDKAPRDFPNDLLRELAEAGFDVPETGQHVEGDRRVRPIVVITSNSERPLPAPFLRRCIYRHLELDPATIRRVVTMRRREFPGLSDDFLRLAVERFLELRKKNLRRKPGTSELLVWLRVLELAGEERLGRLEGLPYAGALLKDHHDLGDLG
jgi:MoxR-like ATPase